MTINNCFALGNVTVTITSNGYAGGLVGYLRGASSSSTAKVINCYSIGVVYGSSSYIGGLIGSGTYYAIANSYFDSSLTGLTVPATQARTTAELGVQSTFTGWDFSSIWIIENNTYPYLKNLMRP